MQKSKKIYIPKELITERERNKIFNAASVEKLQGNIFTNHSAIKFGGIGLIAGVLVGFVTKRSMISGAIAGAALFGLVGYYYGKYKLESNAISESNLQAGKA